jgi:hypothetical protein
LSVIGEVLSTCSGCAVNHFKKRANELIDVGSGATTPILVEPLRDFLKNWMVIPFALDLVPAIGWAYKTLPMPAWIENL